ncbi:hypothetical protein [Pontibacter litorisediminis]|uniref:hypothetical protein n=1 Tax=Pontibacter litorisediminis TaxID=1846260 RepID=UPI0023EB8365|nr:hypothetical protein [Pontibacter litorisediminis]
MKATLLPFSLLASILLLSSCCKDNDSFTKAETVDATLVWTGDYAVDGCGFMLQIGDTYHKPTNEGDISISFKEHSPTEVEATLLDYRKLGRYCQAGVEINTVKIIELRRR